MDDRIAMVLVGLLAVVYGLSALSRRFPHVGWLRRFRFDPPRLSEEHRARMRRRANVHAGAQLILMGLALPIGYGALTVMLFSEFTTTAMLLVGAGSVLCIGLGITAIWLNRR